MICSLLMLPGFGLLAQYTSVLTASLMQLQIMIYFVLMSSLRTPQVLAYYECVKSIFHATLNADLSPSLCPQVLAHYECADSIFDATTNNDLFLPYVFRFWLITSARLRL